MFPLLVVGSASIDDVRSKVKERVEDKLSPDDVLVTSQNFRPNIVLKTKTPFIEDKCRRLRITSSKTMGDVMDIQLIYFSARCNIPNVNYETGIGNAFPVLKTLMSYRRIDPSKQSDACFGLNACPVQTGCTIHVGDYVTVVKSGLLISPEKPKKG